MKTNLIICILTLFIGQATFAQTLRKPDWRTYSIEKVIDLTEQGMRGGWTHAKLIEIFGQPDQAVSLEDFSDQEAGMLYKLRSGLIFRVTRYKDTKTKRFGKHYFASFELIDPKYAEGDSTIWTANYCMPLTEAEISEFKKMMEMVDTNPNTGIDNLPRTDFPPSKLDQPTS